MRREGAWLLVLGKGRGSSDEAVWKGSGRPARRSRGPDGTRGVGLETPRTKGRGTPGEGPIEGEEGVKGSQATGGGSLTGESRG